MAKFSAVVVALVLIVVSLWYLEREPIGVHEEPNAIVIGFSSTSVTDRKKLDEIAQVVDSDGATSIGQRNRYLFRSNSMSRFQMQSKLRQFSPSVEFVQANYLATYDSAPRKLTSVGSERSWALFNTTNDVDVDAELAWKITTGNAADPRPSDGSTCGSFDDPRPVIALLDSGVQLDHPNLKNNLWRAQKYYEVVLEDGTIIKCDEGTNGYNALSSKQEKQCMPADECGHGTNVAGIIAAYRKPDRYDPSIKGDPLGVAPNATILPIKAFGNRPPEATCATTQDDTRRNVVSQDSLYRGIAYAVAMKIQCHADIRVISASWNAEWTPSLAKAVWMAFAADILIVAAAPQKHEVIACCDPHSIYAQPNVIGVTGIDWRGDILNGYGKKTIHMAAPGQSIYTTFMSDGGVASYGENSGVSFSVPFVSGAAALTLALHPEYSMTQLRDVLLNARKDISASPMSTDEVLHGTIVGGIISASKSVMNP